MIKWGSTVVTAVKWGSTNCTQVKWGNTIVFPVGTTATLSRSDFGNGLVYRNEYGSPDRNYEGNVNNSNFSCKFTFYGNYSSKQGTYSPVFISKEKLGGLYSKVSASWTFSIDKSSNANSHFYLVAGFVTNTNVPSSLYGVALNSNGSNGHYISDCTAGTTYTKNENDYSISSLSTNVSGNYFYIAVTGRHSSTHINNGVNANIISIKLTA